ncbi:MAG TPA: class I SAM-dependent methyltransferase, partial [bacterium]|nr:class I SAM-dependent methyltransferase [bacterium]
MERSSPSHEIKRPEALFAPIARRYDLTNTVLSAGLHHLWKRAALAAAAVRPGDRVLDAGTGTGDLAALAARQGAAVAAVDVSLEMLRLAQ